MSFETKPILARIARIAIMMTELSVCVAPPTLVNPIGYNAGYMHHMTAQYYSRLAYHETHRIIQLCVKYAGKKAKCV